MPKKSIVLLNFLVILLVQVKYTTGGWVWGSPEEESDKPTETVSTQSDNYNSSALSLYGYESGSDLVLDYDQEYYWKDFESDNNSKFNSKEQDGKVDEKNADVGKSDEVDPNSGDETVDENYDANSDKTLSSLENKESEDIYNFYEELEYDPDEDTLGETSPSTIQVSENGSDKGADLKPERESVVDDEVTDDVVTDDEFFTDDLVIEDNLTDDEFIEDEFTEDELTDQELTDDEFNDDKPYDKVRPLPNQNFGAILADPRITALNHFENDFGSFKSLKATSLDASKQIFADLNSYKCDNFNFINKDSDITKLSHFNMTFENLQRDYWDVQNRCSDNEDLSTLVNDDQEIRSLQEKAKVLIGFEKKIEETFKDEFIKLDKAIDDLRRILETLSESELHLEKIKTFLIEEGKDGGSRHHLCEKPVGFFGVVEDDNDGVKSTKPKKYITIITGDSKFSLESNCQKLNRNAKISKTDLKDTNYLPELSDLKLLYEDTFIKAYSQECLWWRDVGASDESLEKCSKFLLFIDYCEIIVPDYCL